jgi:hypothetical protein
VNGFRRGILNVAMKPAVLRSAVLQGGSTRIIKLDRNVGMDEVRHFWSSVTAEFTAGFTFTAESTAGCVFKAESTIGFKF